MGFASLTRSKKAVLINVGDGRIFVTSVKWFQMLLDGRANGDMIFLTELTKAKDDGLGSVERGVKVNPSDISGFEGFSL